MYWYYPMPKLETNGGLVEEKQVDEDDACVGCVAEGSTSVARVPGLIGGFCSYVCRGCSVEHFLRFRRHTHCCSLSRWADRISCALQSSRAQRQLVLPNICRSSSSARPSVGRHMGISNHTTLQPTPGAVYLCMVLAWYLTIAVFWGLWQPGHLHGTCIAACHRE